MHSPKMAKRGLPIISFVAMSYIFWFATPMMPKVTWNLSNSHISKHTPLAPSTTKGTLQVEDRIAPPPLPIASQDVQIEANTTEEALQVEDDHPPKPPAPHETPIGTGTKGTPSQVEDPVSPAEQTDNFQQMNLGAVAKVSFQPGKLKAVDESYKKTIVIPRTVEEDVSWLDQNFEDDELFRKAVYVVDDPSAALYPPKNKGNEVMVYLSYIIDHYNNLSDVNIFMHSHQFAWHNNDLLGQDAVQMISRLSSERVQREGYMNMRCHWSPGCPSWMNPKIVEEDINKQEQAMLARTWLELFPFDNIPDVLAQPCCAQFAISRETIRSQPLARYVFCRDWLMKTYLSDYISGRIWEYVWHYLFTGKSVACPKENVCYCDGFGVCFGGENEYANFFAHRKEREALQDELESWRQRTEEYQNGLGETKVEEPEIGKDLELEGKINGMSAWETRQVQQAKERGDVAMNRAKEAGRDWKDGDGF
ncbi:hypothetical protein LCER1_G001325 [Lachnellula cervina]|uniref:Uncharacterized protein n=1 Tax=Lachnellula cervina TaxID=1316786 RepID=A0A7D8YVC1_9HELO|nr:hypothetical protein LCER1_G001325 [Lachnellula cervina]